MNRPPEPRHRASPAADVVVGGGLLGAVVARRLVEAGRRVTIAERGRAVTIPAGSHVRNSAAIQASPDTYFADIDQYLDYIDTDVADRGLPGAFTTSVRGGVGIVWTNNCPRPVAGLDRPELPDESEWDAYFTLAERFLDVRTDEFDDSVRQGRVAERLAPALAGQGREVQRLPLSGWRLAGERVHYVAAADVLGPVATDIEWLDGRVERLEMSSGRADAVRVDGVTHRAGNVFVAAGAVETPVLLWRSGLTVPALGHNLSYHPVLIAQIVLDEPLAPPGADPDPVPRLGIAPTRERPWFVMLLRDTNPLPIAPSDLDVPDNRLIEIQAFAPIDPHPDNRMALAAGGSLTFDVPLSVADEDRRRAMVRDAEQLCSHLGRFRDGCEPQWAPLGTPHLTGSCRMGAADDGRSVTDTDGRVWGTENLFLAGNGVIPTRMSVNPTLTAAALALRTVDRAIA